MKAHILLAAGLAACLFGCSRETVAANDFWNRMSALCGGVYEGRLVSDDDGDELFLRQAVVLTIAECSDTEIRMPLRVGADVSRSWVLTRDGGEMTLRHYHAARPRAPEPITDYGGALTSGSTGSRALFAVDAETKELFEENYLPEYAENIWALEVRPSAEMLAYEMSREGRFFRLEFDTSKPAAE